MFVLITAILEFPKLPLNTVTIALRLMMLIILIIEIILLFKTFFSRSKMGEIAKNVWLSIVSIFITLLFLEAIFMFLPRSHGIGFSLANTLWFDRYWRPFNSYGARDLEPQKDAKVNILFAGDSFAAGQGIKCIEDRFPDIVRTNLKKSILDLQVINLAQTSLDTKSEFESVTKFIDSSGIRPDMIVLQYYGNDIDHIARKHGLRGDGEGFAPYEDLNVISRWIVNGSYLFNFLYWMFPGQELNGYLTYIEKAYSDKPIFDEHMKEIVSFRNYTKSKDIAFLVIIFPLMLEIDLSKKLYVDKVISYLDSQKIEALDLSTLFKDLPALDRIVNRNDAHPSPEVHRLVGEELTKLISKKFSK